MLTRHANQKDDQQGEWNLLSKLPYIVLRCLLDFLSSAVGDDAAGEVPEPLRLRAERDRRRIEHRLGAFVPPGQEEAYAQKLSFQAKRLGRMRPYHIPATRQAYLQHHDACCNIGALRLTCRDVKLAVDHALSANKHGLRFDAALLAAAKALNAPLDRFLASQFFPSSRSLTASSLGEPLLPLLSDTREAARAKAWFRQMADVTLGTAQARLHQARLDKVLAYVWSQWRFAPEKLDALRQQLLLPRSPIVSGDRGAAKIQPPLLKVEYLQREEDFLGQSYALGINACLSLGLPDVPQERLEIWLHVQQAWDHRAQGWDLEVLVTLHTSTDVWRQRFLPSATTSDHRDEDDDDDDDEGSETETERTNQTGRPLRLILLDYVRSRDYLTGPPTVGFDVLGKLWQHLGLGACSGTNAGERDSDTRSWKVTEVLTTLLACLGFAWKDDIELIWNDYAEEGEASPDQGEEFDDEHRLLWANRQKRKDWLKMHKQVAQLNDVLPDSTDEAKLLELTVRRIRRFIGQQRLARVVSHLTQRAQSSDAWARTALSQLDGQEVARQLRVIYVHTVKLEPGEYSSLSDATVELAWRIPADVLHRTLLSSSSCTSSAQQTEGELHSSAIELVIGVSTKLDNCYTGERYQEMVTVRVVGHHPQLRATLRELIACAKTTSTISKEQPKESTAVTKSDDDDEEEGVVLHMMRGDKSRSVMATEAIEFIGHLLGLSLRSHSNDGDGRLSTTTTTRFAESVLAFMYEVARATTWDAEEGTFPLHSALLRRSSWADAEEEEDDVYGAEEALKNEMALLCVYKPMFMS